MNSRILLMYISEVSGHHSASIAVEKAIKTNEPNAEVLNINAFNYTNPIWERVINRVYMSVIKNRPEIWEYLYDNPKVLKGLKRVRELIHKANSDKIKVLLDEFRPDVVACTQAYPCGMIADYKKTFNLSFPLVGILTDYASHAYWIYDNVDAYVVPSVETGQKLIKDGIPEEKIKSLGIPVNPKYGQSLNKDMIRKELKLEQMPTLLIMGGGQGLGSIKKILSVIDRIKQDFQILAVTGTNKKLYRWIQAKKFQKKVFPFGYIDFIDKLMEISTIIITKPGGITTAEALSKNLPIIIVNPLPGQEVMNTNFLLNEGMALKAENENELAELIDWLLDNPVKLTQMSNNMRLHARPDAAMNIAQLILNLSPSASACVG